eukprot:m.327501 g.327501  ORF g.327501 m.327501 type:complete len:204 (+) comp16492_c0_seq5:572-1183(+)
MDGTSATAVVRENRSTGTPKRKTFTYNGLLGFLGVFGMLFGFLGGGGLFTSTRTRQQVAHRAVGGWGSRMAIMAIPVLWKLCTLDSQKARPSAHPAFFRPTFRPGHVGEDLTESSRRRVTKTMHSITITAIVVPRHKTVSAAEHRLPPAEHFVCCRRLRVALAGNTEGQFSHSTIDHPNYRLSPARSSPIYFAVGRPPEWDCP